MASFLGDYWGAYGNAATDRVRKFHRAVQSVQAQTFGDWELVIVADGCIETFRQWEQYADHRIRCLRVPKQRLWSEKVRNAGIHMAKGSVIVYLDTDDTFGPDHLLGIYEEMQAKGVDFSDANGTEWAYIDDMVYDPKTEQWHRRRADIVRRGGAGTSNIIHAGGQRVYWPKIEYRWPDQGYDHDRQFIRHLKQRHGAGIRLEAGEYMVMHVPRLYDL